MSATGRSGICLCCSERNTLDDGVCAFDNYLDLLVSVTVPLYKDLKRLLFQEENDKKTMTFSLTL